MNPELWKAACTNPYTHEARLTDEAVQKIRENGRRCPKTMTNVRFDEMTSHRFRVLEMRDGQFLVKNLATEQHDLIEPHYLVIVN